MKGLINEKTIAALATPNGTGGIAIIRVSGKEALKICQKILSADKNEYKSNHIFLTKFKNENICDEVMAVYFKAPKSYTGEDVVEIHSHANKIIIAEIIKELIKNGCEPAQNGEFTKRAFLNGRIDLSAAEAVIDLINAESKAQINSAFNALKGGTYRKIDEIQRSISEICSSIGACIDYPEQDLEEKTTKQIEDIIQSNINKLEQLKKGYNNSRYIRDGIKITIAGEPNAGKSTLLNALIGFDRAIVTSNEGTTRDTLEESYLYKDARFVFIDTAGLRQTDDEAERQGIIRSKDAILNADIVLNVMDFYSNNKESFKTDKTVIKVINKIDKLSIEEKSKIKNSDNTIYVSAKDGENIELLKELIYATINKQNISIKSEGINNERQYGAVCQALTALINAKNNIDKVTLDFILSDINEARRCLGLINGRTAQSEVIDEIFSRFCVGK